MMSSNRLLRMCFWGRIEAPPPQIILDLGATDVPLYGKQDGLLSLRAAVCLIVALVS
jgi:hypothetical protein